MIVPNGCHSVLSPPPRDAGSAIVEALIGVAVIVSVTTGVALLIVRSRQAVLASGSQSVAVAAAQQKIEQLCALEWSIDDRGLKRSDRSTDLSSDPPSPDGTGLLPTAADALEHDIPGSADYLGPGGAWRGKAPDEPREAAFVRRWSIVPFAGDADDTLVLTVVVLPIAGDARAPLARLQTIRTRTAR